MIICEGGIINEIKADKNSIYLYGAGSLAVDIYFYLQKNGICIEGAIVDDEYYKGEKQLAGAIEIVKLSSIVQRVSEISIVAANAEYLHINEVCEKLGVSRVYYITPIAYGNIGRLIDDIKMKEMEHEIESVRSNLDDDISKNNLSLFLDAMQTGNAVDIMKSFARNDYFSNDIYKLSAEEVYCDVGAYTGDTIKDFCDAVCGSFKHIYAFEGDKEFSEMVLNLAKKISPDSIEVYNTCLWSSSTEMRFGHVEDVSSEESMLNGNDKLPLTLTRALDDCLATRYPISLLKINFPGSAQVIKGARRIIAEDKPKIACVIGFSIFDLIGVVEIIKNLYPDYKIYLRYRLPMTDGLVLYATC